VIGPEGKAGRVQIRTHEMQPAGRVGVAAHWSYKEGSPADDIAWLNRIIDWQKETSDPAQFMENLKTDLEQDEVFVFTPKGKVITLPVGSTQSTSRTPSTPRSAMPASGAGQRTAGAVGTTSCNRATPCDGVHLEGRRRRAVARLAEARAVTPRSQQDSSVFSRERREDALDRGGGADAASCGAEAAARAEGPRLGHPGQGSGHDELRRPRRLYVAIGDTTSRAVGGAAGSGEGQVGRRRGAAPRVDPASAPPPPTNKGTGVPSRAWDDVMVRLSRCCTPVPGDQIIGFITRDRVSVTGPTAPTRSRWRRTGGAG